MKNYNVTISFGNLVLEDIRAKNEKEAKDKASDYFRQMLENDGQLLHEITSEVGYHAEQID